MNQPDGTRPPRRWGRIILIVVIVFVALWLLVSLLVGVPAYLKYLERKDQANAAPPVSSAPAAPPAAQAPFVAEPAPTGAPAGRVDADEYVQRSKVNMAIIAASPLKLAIAWHHRDRGVCPINGVGEIAGARDYQGPTHESMFVGRTANGDCGIEITLRDSAGDLPAGSKVWLEYAVASDTWRCHSDLPATALPEDCRS